MSFRERSRHRGDCATPVRRKRNPDLLPKKYSLATRRCSKCVTAVPREVARPASERAANFRGSELRRSKTGSKRLVTASSSSRGCRTIQRSRSSIGRVSSARGWRRRRQSAPDYPRSGVFQPVRPRRQNLKAAREVRIATFLVGATAGKSGQHQAT